MGSRLHAALLLCLGLSVPQRGGEDPVAGLAAKLRAADKWARADAVEELAAVGSEAAWEFVLGALADPRGEVADTAQLVLAALDEPKAFDALLADAGLRSKEPLVRARAAELLGRLQGTAALEELEPRRLKALVRALGDEVGEVRRMAAWTLERLAERGAIAEGERGRLVTALERPAGSDREPLVRARALAALARLAPESARRLVEAAVKDRDGLVRGMAAGLVARVSPPEGALERLVVLVRDPSTSVRRLALDALVEVGTRSAFGLLVSRLTEEKEERLLQLLVERLQAQSGLKHRRDPRPWRDWLATLPEERRLAKVGRDPVTAEDDPERSRVALAGLPIVSRRVTILIDLSGSIWNVRPDGKTRKQIVDQKLREALESLPGETRFNLIPYTATPIPWKERLVTASPARVREAASWFEARRENGSGNFWDAAMLALEDPEVDSLIVLFDGAPTGGTRHRLELLVPLFLERNQARGIALDLVLVDASRKLQRLWGELALATGGRLHAVSF